MSKKTKNVIDCRKLADAIEVTRRTRGKLKLQRRRYPKTDKNLVRYKRINDVLDAEYVAPF